MLQKLVVGVLMLTIVGAAGVGVYDAARAPEAVSLETHNTAAAPAAQAAVVEDTGDAGNANIEEEITPTADQGQNRYGQQDTMVSGAGDGTGPVQQQQETMAAMNMVGEPWTASGAITAFDFAGMTLRLADGSEVYVELGPPDYWQAQAVQLAVGDQISVNGFNNGQQIHAALVTTASGEQLALRTEAGQPLWSGGTQNGQNGGAGAGVAMVAPDAWQTLSGTVTAVQGSMLTVQTMDGQILDIQLGQPSFWEQQGVMLAVGDSVDLLGYWQGEMFQAGEVKNTVTGERLMLRDPNGRPLWAGPGRNGNGQTGAAGADHAARGAQGQAQGGQGQAQGGQGQAQAFQVPASEWETLNGNVIAVEPLAITVQLNTGELARIALGEVDFWTAQGFTFVVPEVVTVEGFWGSNQFEAGRVTFGDGTGTLEFRDELGQPLYRAAGGQGQGGGGVQYRGGRS